MAAVGRPTDYDPIYAEKMREYFDREPTHTVIRTRVRGGTEFEEQEEVAAEFPTMSGFAISIGTTRKTLWNWAYSTNDDGTPKNPEFLHIYEMAKDYQDSILIPNALAGRYSASFSIFFAKNHLGYADKTEQDVSVKGGFSLAKLHEEAEKALGKSPATLS